MIFVTPMNVRKRKWRDAIGPSHAGVFYPAVLVGDLAYVSGQAGSGFTITASRYAKLRPKNARCYFITVSSSLAP